MRRRGFYQGYMIGFDTIKAYNDYINKKSEIPEYWINQLNKYWGFTRQEAINYLKTIEAENKTFSNKKLKLESFQSLGGE